MTVCKWFCFGTPIGLTKTISPKKELFYFDERATAKDLKNKLLFHFSFFSPAAVRRMQ